MSVIKPLMVSLKYGRDKSHLAVLSCSKLPSTFSYLLNSGEAKDVKPYVEMRLAGQWCVSSNLSALKLATFVGRIIVMSEE